MTSLALTTVLTVSILAIPAVADMASEADMLALHTSGITPGPSVRTLPAMEMAEDADADASNTWVRFEDDPLGKLLQGVDRLSPESLLPSPRN